MNILPYEVLDVSLRHANELTNPKNPNLQGIEQIQYQPKSFVFSREYMEVCCTCVTWCEFLYLKLLYTVTHILGGTILLVWRRRRV
jgi:hypothetical protein